MKLSEDEKRLDEIVVAYLEDIEAGQNPDRKELLQRHPDLAPHLTRFFANQDQLDQLAAPLRSALQAALSPGDVPRLQKGENSPCPPPSRIPAGAFGHYELLNLIASGGMGLVYKARQRQPNRLVALKMIRTGRPASEADVRRFRNEAEMVATLDHPHIVPIYEVGEEDGHLYFSMKLMEGGSLGQRVANGTWPWQGASKEMQRRATQLVATLARAVHHAHQRGVLHRDLKPANILFDADDRPHVTDFGLAKQLETESSLTETGAILGTPAYMAPEQALGKKDLVTTASDVYGLGGILYVLLAGKPPFQGESPLDTLTRVREQVPASPRERNPGVDTGLATICLKCLEKEPGRRYGSAEMLAEGLERWLAGKPILARPASAAEKLWRWCRRNALVAGLLGTVVLLVVIATIGQSIIIAWLWEEKVLTDAALEQAREKEHASRLQAYVARMNQAHRILTGVDPGRARDLLAEDVPLDGQEDVRGFEWYYLWGLCQRPVKPAATLSQHQGEVFSVAYSPDGKLLASAGKDKIIRLWDLATGKARFQLQGHTGEVNAVAFAPDGRLLASASDDGSVKLWDVASGRESKQLHKGTVAAVSLAFSPDGKVFAAGFDNGWILRWDRRAWKELPPLRYALPGPPQPFSRVEDLAFSPDSRSFAQANANGVWLVEADTGKARLVASVRGRSLAFAHHGRTLATAGEGPSVHLIDTVTGRTSFVLQGYTGSVEAVAFSPDDRLLATAEKVSGKVHVWDLGTAKVRRIVSGPGGQAWCVAFSPDGRKLATGGSDGTVRIWDPTEQQDRQVLDRASGSSELLGMSSNGNKIVHIVGPDDGTSMDCARILDYPAVKPVVRLPLDTRVQSCACSADGSTLATAHHDGSVSLWDLKHCQQRLGWHLPPQQWADFLAFPAGDDCLVAAITSSALGDSNVPFEIRLLDTRTGQNLRNLLPPAEGQGVKAISADGKTLAIMQQWGKIRLLDFATGQSRGPTIEFGQVEIKSAAFSPDGRMLAVAISDYSILLCECASGKIRARLLGHRGLIRSVSFSADGKTLASASADSTVRLWNLATGRELMTLIDGQDCAQAAFLPSGKALLTLVNSSDGCELAQWPAGELNARDQEMMTRTGPGP